MLRTFEATVVITVDTEEMEIEPTPIQLAAYVDETIGFDIDAHGCHFGVTNVEIDHLSVRETTAPH